MTDTLNRANVVHTLEREHALARHQAETRRQEREARAASGDSGAALRRSGKDFRDASHFQHAYLSIDPPQGALLYMLARAAKARHFVEFGSSFGISTLYLAAAAEDNDGQVIGSEYYANKREHALNNLRDAGLEHRVDIRLGDAMETLADVGDSIDFLFLDGEKSLYLPVLALLKPRLAPGAFVVADNLDHFEGVPGDFRHEIQHAEDFTSRLIPFGKGMLSVSRYQD